LNKIKKFFFDFCQGKEMVLYLVSAFFLLIIAVFAFGKCLLAVQTISDTKAQIGTMQSYVAEYGAKAIQLNKEDYRPVLLEQVDSVQSDILLLLQANQVNLLSFKNIKESNKTPNGQIFEIDCDGSWASLVQVIQNFHAKDALISILNVKFDPEKDGKVKAIVQYKIYTK
jgi:hypothetical protein